jgi:transcriptional regulator with XRE-family HTH domain
MGRRKLDPKKAYKIIGLNIRHLRETKGWTLENMEEHSSIAWQTLQKVESGRNVTVKTLIIIAHALGVHPSVLLKDI